MFTHSHPVTKCLVLVAWVATAQAEPPARTALRDPQLEALVAEALVRAPETAAAQAGVEAARRRIMPAQTLADPFVSTTIQNDGRNVSLGRAEGSFVGLMASQVIPWPGKLRLAGDLATSEAREIEQGMLGRTALTLEARVRYAWYDLLLARASERILEDRRGAAAQLEASVRERYAAGLAEQQDVLRAQVELVRIEEQQATQAALVASRLAELNRLAGAPQDRAIATPDGLPEGTTLPAVAELITVAAAMSPELAAALQSIETGRIVADLTRKNVLPDFTVSAGSMYRGSFEMGPMWQAGIGVTVPLWIERRQQNQLAEAQAMVRGRTAESEAIARELELRTRERAAQHDAALRIAVLYRDKVVPLDELSLESALSSYQTGKLPFISVLEALDTLYSDRAIYAARLAECAKWRVAIDEAGLQPTSMPGAPSMAGTAGRGSSRSSGPSTAASRSASDMNSMR